MNLAPGWSLDRVAGALRGRDQAELGDFLKTRYEALFFAPLKVLEEESEKRKASEKEDEYWQFGFAIMSLNCLLVEVFYCYSTGLPSTHRGELKQLHSADKKIEPEWVIPETEWPSSTADAFRCFFLQNQGFFPGIEGGAFYHNVRNGLLHQAQTKKGWKIGLSKELFSNERLSRVKFTQQPKAYFDNFLEQLTKGSGWDDPRWKKASRKIWWLIETSK